MTRKLRTIFSIFALVAVASLIYAASQNTWTGVISDEHCAAKHNKASAAAEACVEKCVKGGAAYVFVNGTDDKVYKLDPQTEAKGQGGKAVKVTGTLDGDTIHVKSIEMASK